MTVSLRNSLSTATARRIMTLTLAFVVTSSAQVAFSQNGDELRKTVDTPGLQIEASAGWDGTVDRGAAIPIAFFMTNHSATIIRGELILRDLTMSGEISLGEVALAPSTSRRISTIQSMSNWYECVAELRNGSQVIWRRHLPLNTGQEFFSNISYALFVDDAGRALQLPGALTDAASVGSNGAELPSESGRPVQCLTAKTWQIPNHHAPMIPVQALVFREGAGKDTLNKLQWKSVGKWMTLGGTVFVHEKSDELLLALTDAAPLQSTDVAVSSDGTFYIQRIGLGAIYEYSKPLFSPEGNATRKLIGETIARIPKQHLTTIVSRGFLHDPRGGRADRNRILVIGFFLLYAFLSGVVAIMMFRFTQRKVAIYTLGVVTVACVLSAFLGGVLRFSEGDLNWMTLTQAGSGGAIQTARIEVQSAGGRNTEVSVRGHEPDLQITERDQRRYYYYGYQEDEAGIGPFTWQRNLLTGDAARDLYQIAVPMTPWGTRLLYSEGYKQDFPQLEFKLDFQQTGAVPIPGQSDNQAQVPQPIPNGPYGAVAMETAAAPDDVAAPGTVSVKIVNHLPVELIDCWLILGVSPPEPTPPANAQAAATQAALVSALGANARKDYYHMKSIALLPVGKTHTESFTLSFQQYQNDWFLHRAWEGGQITLPRVSRAGTATAWIVARLEDSPILEIDKDNSDFFAHDGLHLFIQEISPEDIPGADKFFPPPPAPKQNADIDTREAENSQPAETESK